MKLRICSERFWVGSEATHEGRGEVWPFFNTVGELAPFESLEYSRRMVPK